MPVQDHFLTRFFRDLSSYGLEQAAHLFYSYYRGVVTDIVDDEGLARIKLEVPLIADAPIDIYAWPIMPFAGAGYGFFFPPEKGARVYVVFVHGDINRPMYIGGWWAKPEKNNEVPDEVADKTNPTTRLLKTKVGHALMFEDSTAERKGVTLKSGTNLNDVLHLFELIDLPASEEHMKMLSHKKNLLLLDDANKVIRALADTEGDGSDGHRLELDAQDHFALLKTKDGYSLKNDQKNQLNTWETKSGFRITLDEKNEKITIETKGQQTVVLDDKGKSVTITDLTQNEILLDTTGIKVTSKGQVEITSTGLTKIEAQDAVNVKATTDLTLEGATTALTSQGTGATTIQGAATLNYQGALSLTVAGVVTATLAALAITASGATWSLTLGVLTILASSIILGTAAARTLVDSRFLTLYNANVAVFNAHSHAAPGAPPSASQTPAVPSSSYTTSRTKAS